MEGLGTMFLIRKAVLFGLILNTASSGSSVVAQTDCCTPNAAPAAAAAPANNPSTANPAVAAPARQPTMFAAPTPTGEISGARNSIALPSLRISLPKLSLETPEFRLSGFTRFRREPQMQLDGNVAAAAHTNPLLFGQLHHSTAQRPAAAAAPSPEPAAAAPAVAPAAAPAPCTIEGCQVNHVGQNIGALWQQVAQLQKMLQQAEEAERAKTFSAPPNPWQPFDAQRKQEERARAAELQRASEVSALRNQVAQLTNICQQLAVQQRTAQQSPKPVPPQQSVQQQDGLDLTASPSPAKVKLASYGEEQAAPARLPQQSPQANAQPAASAEPEMEPKAKRGWSRFFRFGRD